MSHSALVRLLQICSSALPVGSFAYSNGLESVIESGRIDGVESLVGYLSTLLLEALGRLDLPRLLRMHRALLAKDPIEVSRQSAWLYAARESAEFQAQERQTAQSLFKILVELRAVDSVVPFDPKQKPTTYAESFALAAVAFEVDEHACLLGYAFAWADSHTSAAAKLLSLGPIATQRVLSALVSRLSALVESVYDLPEEEIGASTPGLGIASARHETQYCRLFRS